MATVSLETLKSRFSKEILESTVSHGQWVCIIAPASLRPILTVLKTDFGFTQLLDIVAIDWQTQKPTRFELDYLLYNLATPNRITLKVALEDSINPAIESIYDLFLSADWAERECFDMMGIQFKNHPNLKRLLMWENFIGHPLRKDYALNHRQPIPVQEDLV